MSGTQVPSSARERLRQRKGGGGKRGRLEGGSASLEAIESSRTVASPSGRGEIKGLQQWFSPPAAAALAFSVMAAGQYTAPVVLDPTAGDGALLKFWPRERRYGIEIDADQVDAGDYKALHGDLQKLYPLLRIAGTQFSCVVLNPPFGLSWEDPKTGKMVNSTLQTLRYALGLLEEHGQGMLICGRDRFWREIASDPSAAGVYCVVEVDGMFDGVDLPCVAVFFVKPENRRDGVDVVRLQAARENLPDAADQVIAAREKAAKHVNRWSTGSQHEAFSAIQVEHNRRREGRKTHRWDVELRNSRLYVHLSAFASISLGQRGQLPQIKRLDGKALTYFSMNLREWRPLKQAADDGCLQLDPALAAAVDREIIRFARDACPMWQISPQMRLGFVTDLENLTCTVSDPALGFVAGETYPLDTRTQILKEEGEKLVRTAGGEEEVRDYRRDRKVLVVTVGHQTFNESPESIGYLIDHFDLPDPGDIASNFPDEFRRATDLVLSISRKHGFQYKQFQVDDLARMIVKGSGVLAWEPGLGKTVGEMTFAYAMPLFHGAQDAALFVVPQDLLPQWKRECQKFFGAKGRNAEVVKLLARISREAFGKELVTIRDQAHAREVARHLKRGGTGWYITWYEKLSLTGRKNVVLPDVRVWRPDEPRALTLHRERKAARDRTGDTPMPSSVGRAIYTDEFCPECHASMLRDVCPECGHVHKSRKVPTVASLLSMAFRRGTICIDELSLIRGDDSLRSKAIRGLRCRHPLGGTGTPIANYVDDAFWGLWWTLGNATTRFPYDYDGKASFQQDFCVIETTWGGADKNGNVSSSRRKVLPEVTNLSVFWRLTSQGMVRRRKEDTGEPLAERTYHPVRVPFGVQQARVHEWWLNKHNFVDWFMRTHPDSPLTQAGAGVVELYAAGIGQRWKMEYAATLPLSDPDVDWHELPATNWTPKTSQTLELIIQKVREGDKVLVGSCLVETGMFLAGQLCERGIRAVHILEEDRDGRHHTKSPKKRSREIWEFAQGDAQVLCVGVNAVKMGHNLDMASTVVLDGLPDSRETLKQFIDRVHRLTSKRPVSVYVVMTKGSIDEIKWEMLTRKAAASDMALDGELVTEREEKVDWEKVLQDMREKGIGAAEDRLDERDIERMWAPSAAPPATGALERLRSQRASRSQSGVKLTLVSSSSSRSQSERSQSVPARGPVVTAPRLTAAARLRQRARALA